MIGPFAYIAAAAVGDPSLGDYAPLLNLGAVGVICAALGVFARTMVADLKSQRDKAQDDSDALNREFRENVIPALVEANRVLNRVVTILDDRR